MKDLKVLIFILLATLFSIFSYQKLHHISYLSFSDGAKFADIARNLVNEGSYRSNFSNFVTESADLTQPAPVSKWIPPLMPLAIAFFFKIFGVSDLNVLATSALFYVFLVLTLYLLARKLWGSLTGLLAATAIAFNPDFINYAISGASEPLFAFEIVLVIYLLVNKKRWTNMAAFLIIILMFFTRPQAIIYIFGSILLYLLLNFPIKRALGLFAVVFFAGSLIFLATSSQGLFAVTQHISGVSPSNALRGAIQGVNFWQLFKKIFYNLYNFYRLIPQILSPFMWGFFIIGLIVPQNTKIQNSLKVTTVFMVLATFLVSAATIPFFRYIHPVVPLVYLFATATLVFFVKSQISNHKSLITNLASSFLILFFVVGPTSGIIFLDSRYQAKGINKAKPPVYVSLSRLLRDNTKKDEIIVTNLDTWGSWYGERKTVWFPLAPDELDIKVADKIPYDAIYLVSYKINDENYYMGEEWRQIFENPEDIKNEFIAKNFVLKGVFSVSANETFEKENARAVLLTKIPKN